MRNKPSFPAYMLLVFVSLLWAVPLLWAVITTFRPGPLAAGIHLTLSFTLDNLRYVLESVPFLRYGLNTLILVCGILGVQLITVTMGAYALARVDFAGKSAAVALIMVQIIVPADILIMPNFMTLRAIKLVDSLLGVMLPYFASAMGLLLLRQAYKGIPSAIVDAARIDGANTAQTIFHVFLPTCKTSYIAFAICSVSTHWNNFLWPMIVINSVEKRLLTIGLALFAKANDSGPMWAIVTAATILVMTPLYIFFCAFQKQFVSSFVTSGLK